jgi:Ran GTPase-activating protein (RanGAP) involved in mRNA processing and transport
MRVAAAKYDDLTEKLDTYIADSLACKTSLVTLACTEDERQRMSLLDSNTSCSSHKLNKYLSRKFDAESSRKQLEEKAAAASKQPARLRRLNAKSLLSVMQPEEVDAVYKTPRQLPQSLQASLFEEARPKAEAAMSRPQTSMKNRIEQMGAHLDALALNVDASVGGDQASASSHVTLALNRLLLKSSQGHRPWNQKDLPLIESARARTVQIRAAHMLDTESNPLGAHPSACSAVVAAASPSSSAAILLPSAATPQLHGTKTKSSQMVIDASARPATSTSSRQLLRTSKHTATREGQSPQAKDVPEKGATGTNRSAKKVLNARQIEEMAQEVLHTFYARLLGIYSNDCARAKCAEVESFISTLQNRRVTLAPCGQNDLSQVCAPLANVIPYIPQMRVLEVCDYYINAAASEKLLRAVLRSPQLRMLHFNFCRISLDCCAAVGLALSQDDAGESNVRDACAVSGKGNAEQKKASVMFKELEESGAADAALLGAEADLAGDAAAILRNEICAVDSVGKITADVAQGAKTDESDRGSDGEAHEKKSAAVRLARAKRMNRAASLEKGLPNLVVLKMSRCNLTGLCVAALCVGLSSNRGVKKLDISFNSLGSNAAGCDSLGALLNTSTTLTELHIGHNNISDAGSLAIARGLLANSTLQHLDVQSNLFGSQATQAALAESLRSPMNAMTHLNARSCALDAASATILSEGMVAAPRLKFVDVSHNLLGAVGCHSFLLAHGIMSTRLQTEWNQDSLVIAPLLFSSQTSRQHKGAAGLKDAARDFVFDVSDFPGRYKLSLTATGGYHNSVLRWLLHFEATGRAVICSMAESKGSGNDEFTEELDDELQLLRTSAKSIGAWTMPLDCVANRTVLVTSQSIFNRAPSASDTVSRAYLHSFDFIISSSSSVDAMTAVPFVASLLPLHQWITVSDALSMLKVICREHERVEFCAFAVIALVEPDGRDKIVAALSQQEQQLFKRRLSKAAMEWTPYNVTGHWQLDLEDAVDRRLSHTLCSVLRSALNRQNQNCVDALGFDVSGLPFPPKVFQPGDLWRNGLIQQKNEKVECTAVARSRPSTASVASSVAAAKHDVFPSSRHHQLPRTGLLTLDFVCTHRPSVCCSPVESEVWQRIIDDATEILRTGDFAAIQLELRNMRHRSNSICITSDMLHQLLNLFKLPTSRADIVLMFYRRVIDWIGLQRKLYNWLPQELFVSAVENRIGLSVAFDDFSLVGYYDLQLAVQDHRDFLKRVIMQASDDFGLSVHDWVYDGIQDDCPMAWGQEGVEIPKNSYATFRVCCSPQLVDAVRQAGGGAIPSDWPALQPPGAFCFNALLCG